MYRYENKVYMYNQIVSWERFVLPFDSEKLIPGDFFLQHVTTGANLRHQLIRHVKTTTRFYKVLEEEVTRGSVRYWPLGYNVLMYVCVCMCHMYVRVWDF